mmetsp:Transcript_66805/g.184609  ORF Transcript_66805/g.184609 Transcript_66805/m.184609 type:complete len:348 (+) Transcript_66805:343-1386(+)
MTSHDAEGSGTGRAPRGLTHRLIGRSQGPTADRCSVAFLVSLLRRHAWLVRHARLIPRLTAVARLAAVAWLAAEWLDRRPHGDVLRRQRLSHHNAAGGPSSLHPIRTFVLRAARALQDLVADEHRQADATEAEHEGAQDAPDDAPQRRRLSLLRSPVPELGDLGQSEEEVLASSLVPTIGRRADHIGGEVRTGNTRDLHLQRAPIVVGPEASVHQVVPVRARWWLGRTTRLRVETAALGARAGPSVAQVRGAPPVIPPPAVEVGGAEAHHDTGCSGDRDLAKHAAARATHWTLIGVRPAVAVARLLVARGVVAVEPRRVRVAIGLPLAVGVAAAVHTRRRLRRPCRR